MSSAPRKPTEFRMGLFGGTPRYYAVQTNRSDGGASRVRITPQQAFGQLTTIGDTAQVSDQRTSSLIFGTGGGMGRDKYVETEGITQVRWTDMDTRFEGSAVLPLAPTTIGTAVGPNTTFPAFVDWLGASGATLLHWQPRITSSTGQWYTGAAWATLVDSVAGSMHSLTSLTRYRGAYYLTSFKALTSALYRSTDGVTWVKTGPATTLWHAACTHDNKWYGFNSVTNEVWYTLDPTQPAGAAWSVSNETLDMKPNESVMQMLEWKDESRRRCVMLITDQRLLRFDDEARTFTVVDDWSSEIFSTGTTNTLIPNGMVWKNDDNLYICFYNQASGGNNASTILEYTNGQKGSLDNNKLSGIPAANRVNFSRLVGGLNYLYAFGNPPYGTSNLGQSLCWDGQGWHALYTGRSGSAVQGGGYARGVLYTRLSSGDVISQPYNDDRVRPEHRTNTYDTYAGGFSLYWARTTGGTDLLKKRELWATVESIKKNLQPGLDTNCTLYLLRSLDGGGFSSQGSATSATAFPWQVDLTSKASWREMEVLVVGYTTTAANTPIVRSVQVHFDRTPQDVRDVYDFVIDVAGSVNAGPQGGQRGRDQRAIIAELDAMRGQLVTLEFGAGAYGGAPGKTSVAVGLFQSALEADPLSGEVTVRVEIRDLSTPLSG